ncbi:MAG: ABC transporter ATP-binding protein [Candidatus Ratteibacteria bacterium]|jgi:subfamily B ATP-binding cassette protein MsbA
MYNLWLNIRKLEKYFKISWGLLAAAVLLMGVDALLGGVSLSAVAPLLDRVFNGNSFVLPANLPHSLANLLSGVVVVINRLPPLILLRNMLVIIFAALVVKAIVAFMQTYFNNKFSLVVVTRLRMKIFEKYLLAPLSESQKKKVGERVSHFTYDVGILSATFSNTISKLILNTFQVIVYFSIILFLSRRLTLISLLVLPAFVLPLANIGKTIRELTKKSQVSFGKVNNYIQEVLVNLPVVKAYVAEKREKERFDKEIHNLFRLSLKSVKRYAGLAQITELVAAIAAVLLIYFGAREVTRGILSTGLFMAFIAGLFALFSPLKTIINNLATLQSAAAVFPRVFSVLDEEDEKETGKETVSGFISEISFDSVSFRYGAKKPVLDGLSFRLGSGKRLGIVGESGVGKTTLINLLLRFYQPTEGRLTIDGVPVSRFTLYSYRRIFGLVTQDSLLFNDTIANNITYGRPDAKPEEIVEAARVANIHSLVESLPEKYNTLIGERGVLLSGGERQRLALARAVLVNPKILILDEATSNLDSESERLVQEAMEKVIAGRTCFIIAHRLSTLRDCDWIIVLEKGKIIEEGTHQELLDMQGRYHYLYTLQQRKT